MIFIRNSLATFLLFVCSGVFAQTVVWRMKPQAYSDIKRVGENTYIAVSNGKYGIIRSDGTVVAPVENDNIGGYYEHNSLVTKNDGHGERVMGCLSDNGIYNAFAVKYYTLVGQKFFSDGLLSVADADGNVGYIDTFGNKVVGFDDRFDRIKPFSEGYAAVFKNKRYSLISKSGEAVKFNFLGIAEVNSGTNVYKGKVYVWDTTGKLYYSFVDNATSNGSVVYVGNQRQSGVCVKTKWPGNRAYDYLYRFSAYTGVGKNVPFVDVETSGLKNENIIPFSEEGLFGYRQEEFVVLPCQFNAAEKFEDNLAVVTVNGMKGIVEYVGEESFEVVAPNVPVSYYEGEQVRCTLQLQVPAVWQDKEISVVLTNDGVPVNFKRDGTTCSFTCNPRQLSDVLEVEIKADGLLLYKSEVKMTFKKRFRCHLCHRDIEECRYRGKHPEVKKDICPKCHKERSKCVCGKGRAKIKACPTCGKDIKDCLWHGVHPDM